ncbi:hypothetical protein EC973_000044 [Apophysomyces ossiformis]|uniref:Rab-GAP TBC domain-containing protein n=1 Tax=Apophysomyces ossiformis TaxID=679940 RepID=A0A8H7ETG9_9FUNG|nr:hypothetical protein EC973_000044 [Apophysomyces ossiformis]
MTETLQQAFQELSRQISNEQLKRPRLTTVRRIVQKEDRPYSPYTETSTELDISFPPSPLSLHDKKVDEPILVNGRAPSKHLDVEDKMHERRDQYGFRLPTQWVSLAHFRRVEDRYQHMLQRQSIKWKQFLAQDNHQWPTRSPKLKRYARRGIPQELRGKAWMHYSGAKAKMNQEPDLYDTLLEKLDTLHPHNEYAEMIQRDLHRTFPDNTRFCCAVTSADGSTTMIPEINDELQKLRRVLLAFTLYSPDIGYCQSMNFLVGYFLLFVTEVEAFWLLVVLVHDYFPKNMFDETMEGAHIDQAVLMMLIYEKIPTVWNRIAPRRCFWECEQANNLPPSTLVTSHWFFTLFVNILPVETVLRVWDCLFIEGYEVMFRVALTVIKLSEEKICTAEDPMDALQILQNTPRRMVDCHRLMEQVFSKEGIAADLSERDILQRRSILKNRSAQRKASCSTSKPFPWF